MYEYTPYGIKYHIQKCHCGNTKGSATSHTLDPDSLTIIDGVPHKRCRFCNALVLSNSGGFIPVQGEKPGIEPLIYRREDLDE